MSGKDTEQTVNIRYQVDEKPPVSLSTGLGIQLAVLCIAGVVLTPAIVIHAAGGLETYIPWAVFGAVLVSGITSIIQAVRVGRIGAGYVLAMGTSGAFIAVCVSALVEGGPALMAILVVISSIFQFLLSWRLSLFRKILTPSVAGTVIMLIPVTVMPLVFGSLTKVPGEAPVQSAPVSAAITALVICLIALKAQGIWRLWAPVIGIVAGCIAASFYGIYDFQSIKDASWIGLPKGQWPGLDLSFGPAFWTLLPAFIFVTLVGAIETLGDGIAIQRVSWRTPKAIDYRSVQGAVGADGLGNLLSGLIGTVPNTTYSTSVAVTALTGVSARSVGVALGITFVLVAFVPKILAVVLAIPGPVASAYLTVLLALLFVVGMKVVIQEGADHRKALIVGVSFWIGVGCQHNLIFPEMVAGIAGGIFENGMTAGGLTAILLTLFKELTAPRRYKLKVPFSQDSLPQIRDFLSEFVRRNRCDEPYRERLEAVAEEALFTLYNSTSEQEHAPRRFLFLSIQKEGKVVNLEVTASPNDNNIEDRISLLGEQHDMVSMEKEASLRILRHYASSVHHQQYHDTDIINIKVDVP
ncbi:MAG: hypothetical protein OXF46_07240 [Rhodobacteraceae bacterium]|nr:hypothetical protein [Paracoccaceae bacterium]